MEGIGLNFRDLLRLHVRNFILLPQICFTGPSNGFCILLFHVFVTVCAYESWISEYFGYGSFIHNMQNLFMDNITWYFLFIM
jgi:hypothetical protein